MAMLNVFTETPQELLSAISIAMDEGQFPQWKLDKDGDFRFSGLSGMWRSGGKLSARRYGVGVTLQYFIVRKGSMEAHIRTRAMLHGRMLELLETNYHGWFSHVVFEPKPLRV
jgi:hypothetical protein